MTATTLRIAGRTLTVHGNPDDFYFQNAEIHAGMLTPLGALASRHVGRDGLVVDAGANIGLSTMTLALARPGCPVIAVEPSAVNAGFLRQNLAANGFDNVEVVEAAMSDRAGTLDVLQNGAWSHVVGQANISPGLAGTPVPVVTLDGLAQGRGPVVFVKIDTEGHEPHVLAGGRAVIERDRPLMLIEFHSWCLTGVSGVSPAAFANALWDRFTVERVDEAGTLCPADPSAHAFLHANMTTRGLVEDLVLRLRPGVGVPSLEHMSVQKLFADELHRLRAENAALLGSTSWRLTAPLRAAMTALRPRRPAG